MLVFIDESGYPRPTDSTNNPVLLAVCLHENDIKPITNQIYKLKDSIRHYYENHLDTEEPNTEYQQWLVSLFKKLQHHIKNTPIPDSKYIEFALQKIGTHYTYNVNMNASLPSRVKEEFSPYFT